MRTLEEVEMAIANLPEEDYRQFRRWFWETDWERWEEQIGEDSKAGRLDFLVKEAMNAKKGNKLRDL